MTRTETTRPAPPQSAGPVVGLGASALDVDLLRTLRTYEAFPWLSSKAFVVCDADGAVVYASPAVSALLGHRPGDTGRCDVWSAIHPDDRPAAEQALQTLVATTTATSTSRLRMRAADGAWLRVEQSSANLLHAGARGIVCVLRPLAEPSSAEAPAVQRPVVGHEQVTTSPVVLERLLGLHQAGASPHTIAAALNAQGHRTDAGARWVHVTVTRALVAAGALPAPSSAAPPDPA